MGTTTTKREDSSHQLPAAPRFWTRQRVTQLACLTGDGLSDEEIGRRIGTTTAAVARARISQGITARTKQRHLHNATRVARLLGMNRAQVTNWLEAGWLRGTRGQARGPWRQWVVTHDALLAFLEDRRYWHLWDAERINPDASFRPWAVELRRDGSRLLTTKEVAERCYVSAVTVTRWLREGKLTGVQRRYWLVPESTLATFTPPWERQRTVPHRREWTAEEDTRLRSLRASGVSHRAIAKEMGRSPGAVMTRWGRLRRGRR